MGKSVCCENTAFVSFMGRNYSLSCADGWTDRILQRFLHGTCHRRWCADLSGYRLDSYPLDVAPSTSTCDRLGLGSIVWEFTSPATCVLEFIGFQVLPVEQFLPCGRDQSFWSQCNSNVKKRKVIQMLCCSYLSHRLCVFATIFRFDWSIITLSPLQKTAWIEKLDLMVLRRDDNNRLIHCGWGRIWLWKKHLKNRDTPIPYQGGSDRYSKPDPTPRLFSTLDMWTVLVCLK